jgi:hypothetical protein
VSVPPGTYRWQVERGPEYERLQGSIDVRQGEPLLVQQTVHRLVDLHQERWYSADLHVHRPVDEMPLLMEAEGLDFAPVITWWNAPAPEAPNESPTLFELPGPRYYMTMAGEDEREGGALLFIGLTRPLDLTVRSREYPSPMQFVEQARLIEPDVWIDIEKPFWWDVPTWLASGQMNSMGLANNHMCRDQMLANEAWGRPRDTARLPAPRGNGFWTQEIYYHSLNAGLQIPPSAGSASGVLPNPVGYNRVYVKLDEPFTPSAWFAALRAGRGFVTNGPLLRVEANAQPPGARLAMAGGSGPLAVRLAIDLTTRDRIEALEVIYNGRIVERLACADTVHQQLRATVMLDQPGWFLIRAVAEVSETFRFASTAPWYVGPAGAPVPIRRSSAQFFLDWVEERIARVKQNVTEPAELAAVLDWHLRAREFWAERVRVAQAD